MSPNIPSSSNEPGPVGSVRVARRQLLTARSGHDLPPPRVVLHLPDLNALDGVVLGPPKPAARRRIDSAHVEPQNQRSQPREEGPTNHSSSGAAPTLATLLRGPLDKLAPQLGGATTIEKIGKLIVLVQQPKMLLAALVAVGLQLAAAWAMLTGGTTTTESTPKDAVPLAQDAAPQTSPSPAPGMLPDFGRTVVRDAPVRTPASVLGPGPTLAPSLPPPQNLTGPSNEDLPNWASPTASAPVATQSVPGVAAELPPLPALPAAPAAGPPSPVQSTTAAMTAAPAEKPVTKPAKVRLVGTILKKSSSNRETP
ncbi:MAG: hypothetical protein JNL96_13630 [Planctomycetaceae bacterium]|nr:hypothetical protein [Planctomycetaceae bacterium]